MSLSSSAISLGISTTWNFNGCESYVILKTMRLFSRLYVDIWRSERTIFWSEKSFIFLIFIDGLLLSRLAIIYDLLIWNRQIKPFVFFSLFFSSFFSFFFSFFSFLFFSSFFFFSSRFISSSLKSNELISMRELVIDIMTKPSDKARRKHYIEEKKFSKERRLNNEYKGMYADEYWELFFFFERPNSFVFNTFTQLESVCVFNITANVMKVKNLGYFWLCWVSIFNVFLSSIFSSVIWHDFAFEDHTQNRCENYNLSATVILQLHALQVDYYYEIYNTYLLGV